MKTKLLFSLVIFLTVAAFIFEKKSESVNNTYLPPPPVSIDSEFLINVMQSGIDYNYSEYPDLNTNAWHIYCGSGPSGGWPGVSNDDIFHLPVDYGPGLINKIEENRSHGFRSIMERPRTVHLGFSQRSEYQCETLTDTADYWFYAYDSNQVGNDINDNEFNGNGARVRFCDSGSGAGYVAKDLRSNREQANKLWTPMHNDDTYEWFVMPRIRIDTSVVNNSPNTKVCAIIMLDWNGDRIDSIEILALNFRNSSNPYSGNYLEEFYFSQPNGPKSAIVIDPGVICPGFAKHFWDWTSDDDTNTIKTDFRVYWYGLCDMWIDYVKVENLPAHEFFNPLSRWDNEVRAEADFALSGYDTDNPIPNNFYLEEFEFNMVPSIKHFNELVRSQTGNKISMMVNLNYGLFKVHIPNAWANELSPAQIDEYLINRADIKYAVVTGYSLEGFPESSRRQSYHPVTLSTEQYDKEEGILSYPASVKNYEDSLQKQFDLRSDEGFIKILSKADSLTKIATDLNLILLEQAHLHFAPTHMLKEPSNEEMKVMANIAITYGAKGIMYFAYNSERQFTDTAFYQRGLVDTNFLPRTQSVYGQNKWDGVKEINTTLKKWSPYIMSFDNANRKSYILKLERDNLIDETFFNDVITYKPFGNTPTCVEDDPGSNPSGMVYECKGDRYLQAATFQNSEPNTKYFMIVNRRCSPFLNDSTNNDDNGGRRFVKIKLDSVSSSFTGFNNWSIIDAANDSLIKTFDKNTRADINLGWYLPGEGKLYKLAPVMQEGGALVADEECGGDIECKGEVNNNGKNIFLKPGTIISFADHTARIKMTGGVFKSGYSQTQNSPVYLKGKDNGNWKGISLKTSEVFVDHFIF